MQIEKWKIVDGYNGLVQVSSFGRVRNARTKREYVQSLSCWGYPRVHLHIGGKDKNVVVHRLVAKAFVANPDGLPQVNHIDGDKANNNVTNLEWCTPSENSKHREAVIWGGRHLGGRKKRPVVCLDTGEVFDSVHEANYKVLGRKSNDISKAIAAGHLCGGLRWDFVVKEGE